ncbi:MAG: ISKra4 family transposase [Dehalococcoidia bacterium]|nr:ISKra4 family transposase [Dehalococcoidia bacterium]
MNQALPATMITQLEALGVALVATAKEHRDASLKTLEQAVLDEVRAVLPRLLEEVIQASTSNLHAPESYWQQRCPNCGKRTLAQGWRKRTVTTICGLVKFERPWFVCHSCQHGFSPVDSTLGLEPRMRLSYGLREWIIDLGGRTSFAEAAGCLERLTGLSVSPETVRQKTEGYGNELETAQQKASEQVAKTQQAAAPLDPAPGMLLVETDGVMVRYLDGWHEVKLGLVAGHQGGKMVSPSYIAARMSPDSFGPRLLAEAARRGALEVVAWKGPVTQRGLAVLREVIVLGDGALWIWNLAAEHFGERTEIVDFYHASEHIWTVAKALWGEGTAEAKAWAGERIKELFGHSVEKVQGELAKAKGESPEQAETLRQQREYFRKNALRMDYPAFRARGLPIGSGAVESSAKNLVQQRMKRPGARWSEYGAQAVLNVRGRLLSQLPLAS